VFNGSVHTHRRIGMGFTEPVFSGDFRGPLSPCEHRQLGVHREGRPLHFFDPKEMNSLGEDGAVRISGGGITMLPREPDSPIEQWSLRRLLDFLEVRDLYADVLDRLRPDYTFWEYGHGPECSAWTTRWIAIRTSPRTHRFLRGLHLPIAHPGLGIADPPFAG